MAEFNPCLGEQEDELVALSAIFGEDFSKSEYEDCVIYQIEVDVKLVGKKVDLQAWLPVEDEEEEDGIKVDYANEIENEEVQVASPSKKIQFRRSESRQHKCLMLSVSHLPPLRLEFSFPSDYPVSSKPLYTLSCLWLDATLLTSLCQKLDELWESSYKGEPVVFPWVDWLQNSSLEFLGAGELISWKPYEWDDQDPRDPRGIPEFLEPKTCALKILEFDFQMEQKEFRKESHVCEICFEEREGIFFHFLQECGHKFCIECLLDYCQIHVNEGTVKLLKCPEKECKSSLSPIILRELLNDEDFERWERLLFQQTLDGMIDVLYCPRCNSVVVQDEDKDSKLAQCGGCFFSFCTECQMTWHSTQPCDYEEEAEGNKSTSKSNGKRKRKKKLDPLEAAASEVNEPRHTKQKSSAMKSLQFLMLQKRLGNFQRCPKCCIMVEKTYGCDMMRCSRCGQMFCWSCGSKISGYGHFAHCGSRQQDVNIAERGRGMLENRPVADAVVRMNGLRRLNPGAMKLQVCPQCRQRNMKEERNNHLKCWACRTDFCYQCGKRTGIPVTAHFKVSGGCQQHSDN